MSFEVNERGTVPLEPEGGLTQIKELGMESGFLTPEEIINLCESPETLLEGIEEILDMGVDLR